MEYSIRQLADLAGVSTRTLRYYDEIGLLKPSRVNDSGYRYYGEKEVNLLQQILFYRERDLGLEVIAKIIREPDFDVIKALEEHLSVLSGQQEHIAALIQTVKLTLADLKGEYEMDDKMKFESFKKNLVEENEKLHGKEAREKYGDAAVDEANKKMLGLSEADYERFRNLGVEVQRQLEEAVENGIAPESETGHRIVLLHKDWLGFTWKEYSAQAHRGLAEMYLADERFTAYYDRTVTGCAKFLVEAVRHWV